MEHLAELFAAFERLSSQAENTLDTQNAHLLDVGMILLLRPGLGVARA